MKTHTRGAWPLAAMSPAIRTSGLLGRLLLVSTGLFALALPCHAQPTSGSIEGRVENAATHTAVSHARVSIRGTNRTATTDESGQFYLSGLPAGSVMLHVEAAGLDAQDASIAVTIGQTAVQDFGLSSKALYGDQTVKLDSFVVESTRETNAAAIAVNQQRENANITSVVAADEFGTMVDQNPGELLKYLPGVNVDYFANNITGVSVRGLGSDQTEIQFDGLPTASMNAESVSRGTEVQYQSAADVARVEIRKLPLPEDSANTIGGTINFVRRSAFEYKKLQTSYQALFRSDAEHLTLADMQGVKDRLTSRWKPNWQVNVTDPVTSSFGFALTVGQNEVNVGTHWSLPGWNFGSTANNNSAAAAIAAGKPVPNVPSIYNPGLGAPLNHDAPKMQGKDFAVLRLDWRPVRSLTLNWSLSGTKGWVQNADDIRYSWNAAATGSGDADRYVDATTALGRVGGGEIYHNSPLWRDVYSPTVGTALEARWRKGNWDADSKVSWSESRYHYYDTEHGFFSSTSVGNVTGLVNVPETGVGSGTGNPIPLTVDFKNIDYWGPKTIQAWTTASGKTSTNIADYTVPVDWWSNDVTKLGGARSRPGDGKEILLATKTYVQRYFNFNNPLSVQFGTDWSDRYRNRHYNYYTWRFTGPNTSTSQIGAVALRQQSDFEYGYPGSERISMSRYYKMFQDHPDWFQYDTARSERLTRTSNSAYDLREKIVAPYLQGDWHLFHNRLDLVGGVRYERVMADADGLLTDTNAADMKYVTGQVVHLGDVDAAGKATVVNLGTNSAVNYQLTSPGVVPVKSSGAPIFLPIIQQAGNAQVAAGQSTDTGTNIGRASLPYTQLVYLPKGAHGRGMNDGYFPSLNASYNISSNLNFQIGYARTQARLDYSNVLIPGTSNDDSLVTSGIGAGALGTISMHNPDLKPWRADNYDARLTWYHHPGSYIGIGAFTKRVTNIIATFDTPPLTLPDIAALNAQYPDLNLGPDVVGYTFHSSINQGDGQLDGAEIEVRQSLDQFLGRWDWARGFRFFGTSTYTNPKGPQSTIFRNQRWNGTAALAYSHRRFSANVGYTFHGELIENPNITSNGIHGQQVQVRQDLLDISANYAITRWARLTVGMTNVTDERRAREQRYEQLPGGAVMTSSNSFSKTYYVGLSGNF
jgi:iron complex outermembrane recepter protein